MSRSLASHEGYLLIDNRVNEGVTDEQMRAAGVDLPPGAGRGVFEAPTFTCSHCGGVVVINPARTRERAYCTGCDHHLCDRCGAIRAASGGECKTLKQIIEEVQEGAARAEQSGIINFKLGD